MYAMMAVEVSEMGYSIVHVEKVKGGALRGIENAIERVPEQPRHHSRTNPRKFDDNLGGKVIVKSEGANRAAETRA